MSFIYKISCRDLNVKECYFGSTIDFDRRKRQHKTVCCNENSKGYNYPVYKFIRTNGGWSNFEMSIIEEIDSIDKKIIEKCERKYIEEDRHIVLNIDIPGRTKKERMNVYNIKYREDNKERVSECNKQKVPCDICNKILNKSSLTRHKKTNKKCLNLAKFL